jgi:hypothetical protein
VLVRLLYNAVHRHLALKKPLVLALELGKYNITVNAYAPGVIETPLCAFLPHK